MKKWLRFLFIIIILAGSTGLAAAQCSICTKTSMQLGEKAGLGMNSGILYLMFMPLAIMGYVGYRWWKQEKEISK